MFSAIKVLIHNGLHFREDLRSRAREVINDEIMPVLFSYKLYMMKVGIRLTVKIITQRRSR